MHLALGVALAVGIGNAGWSETGPRAPVEIVEWPVPWPGSRPRDPYVAGAGAVWFVGQKGDYIARFDPGDASFTKVDLEPGTGPHNLVIDASGSVWFASNRKGFIGRYDPANGEIATFPMPDRAARDPHTLVFDGDGKLWFTVQGGNFVGRLDPAARSIDLIAVPSRRARPYGITIAPDGTPWVALFGTSKLASIDPRTLSLREHALPRAEARPRRIGVTSDGRVWYVDHRAGSPRRPARSMSGAYRPAGGRALMPWRSMPATASGSSRPARGPTRWWGSIRLPSASSPSRRFLRAAARYGTWSMTGPAGRCGSAPTPAPSAAPESTRRRLRDRRGPPLRPCGALRWPQPGGATDTARIAVLGAHEPRRDAVREGILAP